jgi:hypothetical protein
MSDGPRFDSGEAGLGAVVLSRYSDDLLLTMKVKLQES